MNPEHTYICIDLKSFYASVECVERGLDPMTARLIVADPERTDQTICLAVSPALKALGIPGRCRVFQIPKNLEYIMATPRMQLYIDYSAEVYGIYLKYIAKEDIHVYSIDEVFMDVTDYLKMYRMSAKELAMKMMKDVLENTGIPAAAGIGSNLYLAKIALDILAKHARDRVAVLDEERYREILWEHRPLTDFWRIGKGTADRLAHMGICTMRQVAEADQTALYRVFGVDAELLIDHAWGREITLMEDIKAYQPKSSSISCGQVLGRDYSYEEGRLIVKEMADSLCLELVGKGLMTDSVTLCIGYSRQEERKWDHKTASISGFSNSAKQIMACAVQLYEQMAFSECWIRRVNLTFHHVTEEGYRQYQLFADPKETEREYRMQKAVLDIKEKFGKNAILKGMDLQKGATAMERNSQIGGHRSGA